MKLQHQLNIAFTALLVVVISATAITVYSLLLNLLIQDEERQLEAKGELLISLINEYNPSNTQQLNELLQDQNSPFFIYDKSENKVLLTTLPLQVVGYFIDNYELEEENQELWHAGNDRFVVHQTELSNTTLVLVTPLDDLQEVRQTFIYRLLVVCLIGIAAAALLSYLLTRRMVTPLSRLRRQLKKIENRQFEKVEPIHASGELAEVEQGVLEMANELQRYIQSQRQFFQNASHELKTPLMTIQGYAEGIKDGVFSGEQANQGLDVMVAEISRLKKIINEMILLAKLDSEESIYQEENVPLRALIDSVLDRALPLANEKNIELIKKDIPSVNFTADKEKMLQALMNIVANAIRHAEGKVALSVDQSNGQLFIMIEDDGPGIPENLMDNLFHRFVKGEGGETGLGLSIARAIVERSGGKITAGKSDLGGASFTISLIEG